jgi:hypothetical protein
MASKSPLSVVREKFGDKAKLVAAVQELTSEELWVARTNESKGLAHVSNAKLLRLHSTFTEVKEKFGSREKLIDAILEQQRRSKDAGLRQKLTAWPVPRLYDAYKSTAKRLAPKTRTKASEGASAKANATNRTPKKAAKKVVAKALKKTAKKTTGRKGSR